MVLPELCGFPSVPRISAVLGMLVRHPSSPQQLNHAEWRAFIHFPQLQEPGGFLWVILSMAWCSFNPCPRHTSIVCTVDHTAPSACCWLHLVEKQFHEPWYYKYAGHIQGLERSTLPRPFWKKRWKQPYLNTGKFFTECWSWFNWFVVVICLVIS